MDMMAGKISPTGGKAGHGHTPSSINAQEAPTSAERTAIEDAATVADLKAAILAWIDSQ